MLNKTINRRTVLKGTAAIAAVSTLAVQTKIASAMASSKQQIATKNQRQTIQSTLTKNERYIYDMVERNTQRISTITPEIIEAFSKNFIEVLGDSFDYKGTFPLIVGEHEVMRCFMSNIGQLA